MWEKIESLWNMWKHVFMTKYVKICKIKYSSFYRKSCETNLSLAEISLSCQCENVYLHINPNHNDYIYDAYMLYV